MKSGEDWSQLAWCEKLFGITSMEGENAPPLSPLSSGNSPRSETDAEEWKNSSVLEKCKGWQRTPRLCSRANTDPDNVFLTAEKALSEAGVPETEWWNVILSERADSTAKRRMLAIQEYLQAESKDTSPTYSALRDSFLQRWGVLEPINAYDCAMTRLECESVKEALITFERLHKQYLRACARERVDRPIPEDRMAYMFREALPVFVRDRLSEHLRLMRITNPLVCMSLAQCIEAAHLVEEECLRMRVDPRKSMQREENEEGEEWTPLIEEEEEEEEGVVGTVKHRSSDTSTASSARINNNDRRHNLKRAWWELQSEPPRCYRCGGAGHKASVCNSRIVKRPHQ